MSAAAEPKSQSDSNDASGISVLVVDDTEANRDVLARRLARRGYQVSSAIDGAEALEKIAREPFDLVLLDVMMPGISGLDVLRQLRVQYDLTELPIIMATAKDRTEDVVIALDLGANDYVTKPLDFDVVMARVRTHTHLRQLVKKIKELESRLEERNKLLETEAYRTERELRLAARVQEAYLPDKALNVPGLDVAWTFRPCQQLAGDSLNVVPLDEYRTAIYVLDVAGHGAAASLQAVAATRLLGPGPASILRDRAGGILQPHDVLGRLNDSFGWNPATEQFLTVFYAIIDMQARSFSYSSAGHPGAIRIARAGPATTLEGSGMPIGFGDGYKSKSISIETGDRFYLYSDGVTEAKNEVNVLFGIEGLAATIQRVHDQPLVQTVESILSEIETYSGGKPATDDVSVLAVQVLH